MDEDRGSALPSVALLLAGSLLALGLIVDVGRWSAVQREAAFAADVGAEAGASRILVESLHRASLELDLDEARGAAVEGGLRARPRPGRVVIPDAQPDRICVSVHQPFSPGLLRFFGIGEMTVVSQACAVPARG